MKLFFKILLGGFVLLTTLILIGSVGVSYWGYREYTNPGELVEPVIIEIPKGSSIGSISEILSYHGLANYMLFNIVGRLTGQAANLKAGEYEIPARASMEDIMNLLESGKVIQRHITVREGLTNWEIKQFLINHGALSSENEFLMKAEGLYLPETYSYQKGDSVADFMNRMNEAMTRILDEAWEKRAPDLPFTTKEEALVLASIVEKETAVPEERRRVAGVFINRLKRGIPLQTDPTVIYALTMGEHKNEGQGPLGRRLLKKDLEIDSPYNTYKYSGLPPTPIANAGKASIEAVLNPEEHEYIYFVADGTGGHAFARTLDEHNRNVANWRKIRRAQQ